MILTRRFFLLAALGLPLSLCGIFSFSYVYLALAWEFALALAAGLDMLPIHRSSWDAARAAPETFRLMQLEPVMIALSNFTNRDQDLFFRDVVPPAFETVPAGHVKCAANSITEIRYQVLPVARGIWQWGDLHVRIPGRLGISAKQFAFRLPLSIRIYPRYTEGGPFALSSQKKNYLAAKRYRQRGPGKEFESLRPYRTGDDPRTIDWKASARRDVLITRQYEVEKNQTLFLMIDCGRLMTTRIGPVGKLDYVLNSAASMAYLALDQGDFVGVMAFSSDMQFYLPPTKGLRHFQHLIDKFCVLEADAYEPDYQRTFAYFHTIQKRRALVAIYTDFLDLESSRNLIANL
ncbi:MAG TPA: DUF58 domain-containing protein, partial [Acidobacteriota bacterium]